MNFEASDSSGNYSAIAADLSNNCVTSVHKQKSQKKTAKPTATAATTSANTGSAEAIGEDGNADDGDGGDDSEPPHRRSRQDAVKRSFKSKPITVHKSTVERLAPTDKAILDKLLVRGWAVVV